MGTFTPAAESDMIAKQFGGVNYTHATTHYLALTCAGVEVSGGGYARKAVTNNQTTYSTPTGSAPTVVTNAIVIEFDEAAADWPDEVDGFEIHTHITNDTPIAEAELLGVGQQFTAATSDTITCVGHGLLDGQAVRVRNQGGGLPAPLDEATKYFVRDKTDDTFKLALTQGGAAIDITTIGTGIHKVHLDYFKTVAQGTIVRFKVGELVVSLD